MIVNSRRRHFHVHHSCSAISLQNSVCKLDLFGHLSDMSNFNAQVYIQDVSLAAGQKGRDLMNFFLNQVDDSSI